jgi:hypothetical protein
LTTPVDRSRLYEKIDELFTDAPQRDPYKRYTILSYQLAGVGKNMRYSMIYPDKKQGYLAYMKTELSDLLIQTIIMCRLFGYDVDEMLELGLDRLDEYKSKGNYKEV